MQQEPRDTSGYSSVMANGLREDVGKRMIQAKPSCKYIHYMTRSLTGQSRSFDLSVSVLCYVGHRGRLFFFCLLEKAYSL